MHYVIIGNGVAGINAANTIRGRDDSAKITIVSYESDHFFSRTALMYLYAGQLSDRCVEPFERDHYSRMKFERVRDHVEQVEFREQRVRLRSGEAIHYDKLLIASGSLPVAGPWPGSDLEGVGHFVTWQDLEWLRSIGPGARSAAVIGGGLIGIEVAEILLLDGVDVHFLVREPHFWPVALNQAEASLVSDHMRSHGCDLRLSTEVSELVGSGGRVSGVRTKDGGEFPADLVVVAIGVRPQTDFLRDSGLSFDERGGIVVDDQLQTGFDNVWAAGDCTSVVWFNGVRRPEQLWYTSRDQGRIAGRSMVGDAVEYKRGIFYNSAKFFDIEYTTAGYVNFNFDGERDWYQHEPGTNFSERITSLPDGRVIGFNMLGRRWDHVVMTKWIAEERQLEWVLAHLHEALFDEEFMPKFKLIERR